MREHEAEGVALPTASRQARRRRILVLTSFYLPGVKGGGPIRSIAALAEQLGNELDLFIVCQDRDLGDRRPYEGIRTGEWIDVGNAKVQYLPCSECSGRRYRELLEEIGPDVLYLNTLFSIREFVTPVLAARRWRGGAVSVVVAPRGCLDRGALSLKPAKKRLYLGCLRLSRLHRRITWQASSNAEARFIRAAVGSVRTVVASDLPSGPQPQPPTRCRKDVGTLRVVFLSRVSPKKNLLFLLERLRKVRGHIELTVAGPIEDIDYWNRSKQFADDELRHVELSQIGTVPHDDIPGVLAAHHLFVLPTLGENFGHVILEACDAGIGVVISDRTPWHGLAELGAGWELPLEDTGTWESALQQCTDMDNAVFNRMSSAARSVRSKFVDLDAIKRDNLALFGAETSPEGLE